MTIFEQLLFEESVYIFRMLLSVFCGAAIGIERERRQKSAGVRTHIITALAACLMMIVSKYGFFDVVGESGISLDASRIAAGVVSAIGFMGAGVIFVRRDTALGLTTAAGIWATVGIGIAAGAGMYAATVTSTLIIILAQSILHFNRFRFFSHVSGTIKVNITKHKITVNEIKEKLSEKGIKTRSIFIRKKEDSDVIATIEIVFPLKDEREEISGKLGEEEWLSSLSLFSSL